MADFNKLKDTIRGAIYPNGRGAISADKHQAALLDMADTMQETDTKLTELSAKTIDVSKENTSADEQILIEDDNGNVIVSINSEGADFKDITLQGKKVALEEDIAPVEKEASSLADEILLEDDNYNLVGRINKGGADFRNLRSNGALVKNVEDAASDDIQLRQDIAPLCDLRINEKGTKQTLRLKDADGGRYLLALHRKANDGTYMVQNDVFLPTARKDFADVRIFTNDGETLSQRVLFNGNFDVLKIQHPDKLNGRIHQYNGKYYCGGWNNGIYESADAITWTRMAAISEGLSNDTPICLLRSDGTMFFGSDGVLYKSAYPYTSKTAVLNENTTYANSNILSSSMAEDDKGNLYIGHYQEEYDIILKKSTDGGNTWNVCYRDSSGKYQHIHAIFFDTLSKTLYVGCDGGGGVLVSKDNGNSFIDLRDVADIPQSTDYGVIYAEKNFRLLGGETSIVGGGSIIKTEDDVNFKSVLDSGKACYYVRRIGEYLVATQNSSNNFNTSQILYSEDNGDTWKLLYTTACHDEGGPSDGFRDMTKVVVDGKEKLYVISRGASFSDLIIEHDAESHYAEVIVDVPSGVQDLNIECGYAMRCSAKIVNDVQMPKSIFYAPLTSEYEKAYVGGYGYATNAFNKVAMGGRSMADIYPPIRKASDLITVELGREPLYEGDLTLTSNIHIGFWMASMQQKTEPMVLMSSSDFKIDIREGYKLFINDSQFYNFNVPMVGGAYIRVDMNITRGGAVEIYVNGRKMAASSKTCPSYTLNNSFKLLYCNSGYKMQHFAISEGHIEQSYAQKLYDGHLSDNK